MSELELVDPNPVREMQLPDECRNDSVVIYYHSGENPFRATQFYHRETFEDGTLWFCEADIYGYSEALADTLQENTHIPIEDIRVQPLPTHEPEII